MKKQVVNAGPKGAYSSAVIAGEHCYLAGVGGLDPATGTVVHGGVRRETQVAMQTAQAVLEKAGFALSDVVSVTCYLRDMAQWQELDEAYGEFFSEEPPARAAVGVASLPFGISVEFSVVAWRGRE